MVFADKLHDIINCLEANGVILYPGDTTWSIGCSSASSEAMQRIQQIVNDADDKALTLVVDSLEMLKRCVHIHPRIETLHMYHERPFTVVYPDPIDLPDHVLALDGSVPIRIATDLYVQKIVNLLGVPLACTGAHLYGAPYPEMFQDVDSAIVEQVDYICKHRHDDDNFTEPSVLATYDNDGDLVFLRD